MTANEPSFVDTREGRFAYLAAGDPDAPLVLCAHGFPDHAPSFLPLMAHLARAGYRAVAPWMRGYVPSVGQGPYHVDQLAADLVAIADALGGDHRSVLVGHDWGALATYVALQRAPRRFRRAITMAVPHPGAFVGALRQHPGQLWRSAYVLFFQLPVLPERSLRRPDGGLVRRLWRRWSPGYELPDPDWQALRACLEASMPAPIEYYRALTRPLRDAAERAHGQRDAAAIETGVLQLHGARDGCIAPGIGADQARFFAGDHRRLVLPDVGHFLQLEAPERVAEHVLEWLAEA